MLCTDWAIYRLAISTDYLTSSLRPVVYWFHSILIIETPDISYKRKIKLFYTVDGGWEFFSPPSSLSLASP
jgi:hypothetical protein